MIHLKRYTLLGCVIIACIGGALVLYATSRWGIGVSSDPAKFIDVARNVAAEEGLVLRSTGESIPLTHYPPLYPLLLALPDLLLDVDPLDSARWLHILLMVLNSLWVGLAIRHVTDGAFWPSLLGSFLMILSPIMIELHTMAYTEALFYTLGFSGMSLLAVHLERSQTAAYVVSAGLVGLALLTRYAGAAFVLAGGLGILLLTARSFRQRIVSAGLWMILAGLPLAVWLINNHFTAGNTTNRQLVFHPISWEHLRDGVFTLSGWILPWILSETLRLIVLAVLIAGLSIWLRPRTENVRRALANPSRLVSLLVIVVAVYIPFSMVSISLFDFGTPMDTRILSPVFIAGLVIVLWAADRLPVARHWIGVLIGGAYVANAIVMAWGPVRYIHTEGSGYTGRVWQESEMIAVIEDLPAETLIYSNGPDAIYTVTGRYARRIPTEWDTVTSLRNDQYNADLDEMRAELTSEEGVLVYFSRIGWRWYLPTETDLTGQLPLEVVVSVADGRMYRVKSLPHP